MALFGFGKNKKVRCEICGVEMSAGDARAIQGRKCCPNCYQTLSGISAMRAGTQGSGVGTTGWQTASGPVRPVGQQTASAPVRPVTQSSGTCPRQLEQIRDAFNKTQTRFTMDHSGDQWELVANASDAGQSYQLKFICKDAPGSAVALRVFSLVHIDPSKHYKLFPLLNKLQDTYRFLRFTLDSDNDVKVEYDFPTDGGDLGPVALEMMIRTVKILDGAYPELMKCAWS